MKMRVALIRGDGIGPEVIDAAVRVLDKTSALFGHTIAYENVAAGGCSIDAYGVPLTKESLAQCKSCGAILLGAVGGPKWDNVSREIRPEKGLLELRSAFNLYANLRPAHLDAALVNASPLRSERIAGGFDFIFVRELIGGIYFGAHTRSTDNGGMRASDIESYGVSEIERIGRKAFEIARSRRKKVTSIDKANVLESSALWREVMHALAKDYPDVAYSDMLVDSAAMQLVVNPAQFDVIVTSNIFGDILSDEAAALTGSIGLIPSASMGDGPFGLYEPIHGSAPEIAGQNKANPLAAVYSAAMMLRHSFGLEAEAAAVEAAVSAALGSGARTRDMCHMGADALSTEQMADTVLSRLHA
jgi:3-isopropylmalate dehydrogenase